MYENNIIFVEVNTNEENPELNNAQIRDNFTENNLWNQLITPNHSNSSTFNNSRISFNDNTDGISLLLTYSRFQTNVMETTRELHDLTSRIELIQRNPPVLEDVNLLLPPLMASLMESRERAKRLYRSTISNYIESCESDIHRVIDELEKELFRTDKLLDLYPRRGTFY